MAMRAVNLSFLHEINMTQSQADKVVMLAMASNVKTPATKLKLITNKHRQVNYLITLHPKAKKKILKLIINKIKSFRCDYPHFFDDYELNDELALRNIIRHPNIDVNDFIELADRYPDDALLNPSFMRFYEIETSRVEKICRLFESPNLPVELIRKYAENGTQSQKLALMTNCRLPSDVKRKLTPDKFNKQILTTLRRIKNQTKNKFLKNCLDRYSQRSKRFCVPRFLPFDRFDLQHRLQDQVLCGFPYTSAKWLWPVDAQGAYMQPFAQIDLRNAGKLLDECFGDGILQLWTSPRVFEKVELTLRVIPRCDMEDPVDNFYPDKAPWLDKLPDGELEFNNCICFGLPHPYVYGFDLDKCRVDWVYMVKMFGHGISELIFNDDEKPELHLEYKKQPLEVDKKIEDIDYDLHYNESIVSASNLNSSLNMKILCTLGGFSTGVGVNANNNFFHKNVLFFFQPDSDILNSVSIIYHKNPDQSVSFSCRWYVEK